MSEVHQCPSIPADQQQPLEWLKLIRKLRWIGLDDEARRLQLAVTTVYRPAGPIALRDSGTER